MSGRERVSFRGGYREYSGIKRGKGIMEHEGLSGVGNDKAQ